MTSDKPLKPKSPLTNAYDVSFLKKIDTNQLIDDWRETFDIDISEELEGCKEIYLYQCNQTKLKFFVPFKVAGSGNLYEQLSKFSWYYIPFKWEHNIATERLKGCKKVLEVGCGQGAFVKWLITEYSLDVMGIDLNQSAVQYAQSEGIPVFESVPQDILGNEICDFDAICSFQVLEHTIDPLSFFKKIMRLTYPGGKIIITVPNARSFIKYAQRNLLDQPPHHMHCWCKHTFHSLTKVLPLEISQIKFEPLASYHVDWYLGIQLSRLPEIKFLKGIVYRFAYYFIGPILKKIPFLRSFIVGHTLYVDFVVTEELEH